MKSKIAQRYLLTGLAVWLPVVVTFVVLRFIVDLLDKTIALFPHAYQPEQLFGFQIPGLGVVLSMVLLLLTGLAATNLLGQRLASWGDRLLLRIPLVRSIYNATKQVINAILASDSKAFRKVLLIEYPRKGLYSIAFQTGGATDEVVAACNCEMLSVFVPTTPNPTSGFIMMVPATEVQVLDMSIDEALKYIISLGVMQPQKIIKGE